MMGFKNGDRVRFTQEGSKKVGDERSGVVVTGLPDGIKSDVVSIRHDDGTYTTTVFSWWLEKVDDK